MNCFITLQCTLNLDQAATYMEASRLVEIQRTHTIRAKPSLFEHSEQDILANCTGIAPTQIVKLSAINGKDWLPLLWC